VAEGLEFESWLVPEFSLLLIQISSGTYQDSYSVGTRDSFPGGKGGPA
jgi:hypothetical protein